MSSLITNDLFNQILLQPAINGADELFIVSGYASSAMVAYHAKALSKSDFKIHLIVGMASKDGLAQSNHLGFKKLMETDLIGKFQCSYLLDDFSVHSKVYSWLQCKTPQIGFTGSANYSQQAFLVNKQKEVMAECDSQHAYDYFHSLIDSSIYCDHQDAEFVLDLYRDLKSSTPEFPSDDSEPSLIDGLEKVSVSLLGRKGEVEGASGPNWGYAVPRNPKSNEPRNRNDAYLHLVPEIYNGSFFPDKNVCFNVKTDDGRLMEMKRTSKPAGTELVTPNGNHKLGEYLRFRLELSNGEFITKEHLFNYGRTDVTFYKIDENEYLMDFSV